MKRNLAIIAFVLIAIFAGVSLLSDSSAASDLDYFKGRWTVAMRNDPKTSFLWEVTADLDGSWLSGSVEINGTKITRDHWRQNARGIERYAFTSNGVFVSLRSSGWEGDRLIFRGKLSDQNGEVEVRETITKANAQKFTAVWERLEKDGKWTVFGDEICTRH